ncbi:streptogrisin C [Lipingzhangella halophila]|uniref:Streptogrisin C n=1 Tax=Lipingzhangella halophila TaxID=1783352 RepID=A0A7W7W3P6_9ACTN|nr:S1 family peptidase [Lipingzhangella halophila]MBB4932024.1 streptogrisin C [Lipingzhangella halophila]
MTAGGHRAARTVRTSPLAASLGVVALAAGLLAAAPGTAAASPHPPTGGFGQALQRDLDLSADELPRLLDQQRNARAHEAEIRGATGDAFAGAVFDPGSGELTASVTDSSAVSAVRRTGAQPRVVRHGEEELDRVVARLNAEGPPAGSNVTGWYPDIGADTVVVTVTNGAVQEAEEFISRAGVDSAVIRVVETAEAPRTFAPIVGGNAFTVDGDRVCSVGFSVESETGNGFVTAGHCGNAGDTVAGEDGGSGVIAESVFPDHDMAWASTEDDWDPTPRVSDHEGGDVTVTGAAEAPVGASVCRSGSTSGWRCGTIEARNQTVVYPEGMVTGLTRTDACAEPGDSGGPFLSGDQAQGVTSGGSGDCGSEATTFFQPVGPILDQWNLDLVTG